MIDLIPKVFWFVLIIFALIFFSSDIRNLLKNVNKFKGLGVEVELIKSSIESYNKTVDKATFQNIAPYQQAQIINRVNFLSPMLQSKKYKILWDDPHPENNVYIKNILEQIGFKIECAATTHAGLEMIKRTMTSDTSIKKYDLAITNLARANSEPDGLVFADSASKIDYAIPVIFFSGHYNEDSLGIPKTVFAVAHRPDFLINYILDVVERGGTPFPQSNVPPRK